MLTSRIDIRISARPVLSGLRVLINLPSGTFSHATTTTSISPRAFSGSTNVGLMKLPSTESANSGFIVTFVSSLWSLGILRSGCSCPRSMKMPARFNSPPLHAAGGA
jgi:hypothetical protein